MTLPYPHARHLPEVLRGIRLEVLTCRHAQHLTISAIAADAGVSRHTLGPWLNGHDNVSTWTLRRIAAWLVRQPVPEGSR